jgi:CDP-4-dehydro-6-deoxyglucose reductase
VFQVESHETVLAAALRLGVGLPYGCKNGACGSCKGRVVEGRVVLEAHQEHALSAQEAAQGMALFCSARPETDLVIEVREVAGVGDIPIRKMPCRVAALERLAPDVARLMLQLPATERFQYLAGQYIELILKDGRRRSYSMAGPPNEAEQLELHIRHTPGGAFTDHVFGAGATQLKVRDILRFEGPFGTFTLREESPKPIIFLASGTGFAPIKAMVESQLKKVPARSAVLYWGGRRPADLYLADLARSWEEAWPGFGFVPVISEALPEDEWKGRCGFVHRAVLEDFSDLSGHQVYACGAPIVVDSARDDFVRERGLPEDEFFADAFTTEADLARQATLAG